MSFVIANVLLTLPLDITFYYLCPENVIVSVGDYVIVPFGKRFLIGIIVDLSSDNLIGDINLKYLQKKLSIIPLRHNLITYLRWVSQYNIVPLGSLLKMVIGNVVNIKSVVKIESYSPILQKVSHISKIKLSDEQKKAYTTIIEECRKNSVILLDGQTGSGKTEVYCSVADTLLSSYEDSQVLVILPEIILAVELIKRISYYFESYNCVEWHSSLTTKQRRENWLNIVSGKASIIIGTRSALFLPYRNLKLIVVDEEHETSFKQDKKNSYNARDMAVVLGKIELIPIILSSATPSLETICNVKKKHYKHVLLSERFGVSKLPVIKVVDMRISKLVNKYLSEELYSGIKHTLNTNNQVMLFLNRRGYSQLKLCKFCGFKIKCPNCSTWLVEHKVKKVLLCHYCLFNSKIPNLCSQCLSDFSLISFGVGIERLAEDISGLIPEAKIALLSSDIDTNKLNSLIRSIINEEVNIIIGTQIIAKGHNFPKLTFVGIIDADLGLESCDLRATEKTYQLLHQVSGRSGRFQEGGEVILQTYDTNNPLLKSIALYDRDSFYNLELESRRIAKMPPYIKLIAMIISSETEVNAVSVAQNIVKALHLNNKIEILGPSPAPISFLNKHYRYRILIKVCDGLLIRKCIKEVLQQHAKNRKVKIIVDVDPINFM